MENKAGDIAAKREAAKPADTPAGYGVTFGRVKDLKNDARVKLEAVNKQQEAVTISMENLEQAWKVLLEEITREKVIYRNAIQQGRITFEGHNISIHSFGIALEFLRNNRIRLLEYFKKHFQNEEINVLLLEMESGTEQKGERALSAKEIFEKMAAQNPALKKLKDSLGMDFEY